MNVLCGSKEALRCNCCDAVHLGLDTFNQKMSDPLFFKLVRESWPLPYWFFGQFFERTQTSLQPHTTVKLFSDMKLRKNGLGPFTSD